MTDQSASIYWDGVSDVGKIKRELNKSKNKDTIDRFVMCHFQFYC